MAFAHIDDEPEHTPLPTADEVREQIADWERRIDDLYRDILAWLPKDRGYEVDLSRAVPVLENLQRLVGVPAYHLPLLQIRKDGKRKLVFLPRARWVMFARGVVSVSIDDGRRWAKLLAKEAEADGPEWSLYDRESWQHGGDAWTPELLASLLGEPR